MILIPYILVSVLIAWIWIDYFRYIDIFEKESLKYLLLALLFGGASAYLALLVKSPISSELSFIFFRVSIEELSKLILFLGFFYLFKKEFNEPVDYIIFICIVALGFSALENYLMFQKGISNYQNGDDSIEWLISARAILGSVGHMVYAAIIGYGFVLYKYHPDKPKFTIIVKYFCYAVLCHFIYNILTYNGFRELFNYGLDLKFLHADKFHTDWSMLFIFIYFLITISVFSTILNNSLNNSTFFSYTKSVNPDKVLFRLLMYYGILFLIQLILYLYLNFDDFFINNQEILKEKQLELFLTSFVVFIYTCLIVIVCVRLSRFKLIENRWLKLKLELPFLFGKGEFISIKGDSYNESLVCSFYQKEHWLYPIYYQNKFLRPLKIFIEKKVLLKDDETFFLTKIFNHVRKDKFDYVLIKPKIKGEKNIKGEYPIVKVLKIDDLKDIEDVNKTEADFKYFDIGYIKPKRN